MHDFMKQFAGLVAAAIAAARCLEALTKPSARDLDI
jgi:hypothetical protein